MSAPAKVYAQALYEVAFSRGDLDSCLADLVSFLELSKSSSQLGSLVLSPTVVGAARVGAVVKDVASAAGLGGTAIKFLSYLASKRRLCELPEIILNVQGLKESAQEIESGVIESASELSADEFAGFTKAIEKRIGKKVRLEKKRVPALLGGAVVRVAGKTFDASLRTQLENFKGSLV